VTENDTLRVIYNKFSSNLGEGLLANKKILPAASLQGFYILFFR